MYPNIAFDDTFKRLVEEVREIRKSHTTCHSAKDDVNLLELLKKIIHENFFKSDYNQITGTLLFDNVPYIEVASVLQQIIESQCFPAK